MKAATLRRTCPKIHPIPCHLDDPRPPHRIASCALNRRKRRETDKLQYYERMRIPTILSVRLDDSECYYVLPGFPRNTFVGELCRGRTFWNTAAVSPHFTTSVQPCAHAVFVIRMMHLRYRTEKGSVDLPPAHGFGAISSTTRCGSADQRTPREIIRTSASFTRHHNSIPREGTPSANLLQALPHG